MFRRFVWLVLFIGISGAIANAIPLTVKDISLMLRSGYSNRAVLDELAARRFADNLDVASEKQLIAAGANQTLIAALESGDYKLSPSEVAAARKTLAAQQTAVQQPPVPSVDSQKSVQSTTASVLETHDPIYQRLKDDLVYWHQGNLIHFDDESLRSKKLYLLFFSAFWSKDGRQFTPRLVEYYNRVAPQHPEFEVIFFSEDRSQFGMESYFSQTNMPWPAVDYEKRGGKAGDIQGNLVKQIPCLILADSIGRVLANTSEKDSNPDKVLAELDRMLGRTEGSN